ncbi:hypothetical protein [Nocardioides baekrokdamisoli]|uniref:hypothetical protein n=1 Tax=Nocardioides baekrokdamisoli TaxID=1804624 RepID=UPI000F78D10D|nr:hypothetical protein [Nocardioides baekrokdamisoli]
MLVLAGGIGIGMLAFGDPSTRTINFTLVGYEADCSLPISFGPGFNINVIGDGGKVVGTTPFGQGTSGSVTGSDGSTIKTCTYQAAIKVPTGQASYKIDAGMVGGPTFSAQDLAASGWSVSLTQSCPKTLLPC